MKRKFIVPVRYAIILFLLPLSACHKFIDWEDAWKKNKPGCRIERIIAHNLDFIEDPLTADFTYNAKGDPVFVEFNQSSTGRPHLRFHYDDKGRLAAYTAPFSTSPNTNYLFYELYQYDNKGRVITDTTYGMGEYINGVPQPFDRFKNYAHYEYDDYNRIKKITRIYISLTNPPVMKEEFFYNDDGNLSRSTRQFDNGPIEESFAGPYDNKVNMNLTSKVWMFVQHDYSRNNPVQAAQYNKAGLPIRFEGPKYSGRGFLYSYDITNSEIIYRCK